MTITRRAREPHRRRYCAEEAATNAADEANGVVVEDADAGAGSRRGRFDDHNLRARRGEARSQRV
jgi:hypothetical protein